MSDQIAAAPTSAPAATESAPQQTQTQAPPVEDYRAKAKELEARYERQKREHIIERRKWESTNKSISTQQAELAQLKKAQESARLNPPEFLKSIYGENWYETVVESRLNGIPPAALLQQEIGKLREEYDAKFAQRDTEQAENAKRQAAAASENARKTLRNDAASFYESAKGDYPIFESIGSPQRIGQILSDRIEQVYKQTVEIDEESGEVVRQGKVLSMREAADLIEGEMLQIIDKAKSVDKYKSRFLTDNKPDGTVGGPRLQQDSSQQSKSQPQRRNLSNELTSSTKVSTPAKSLDDKRERAIAAFEEARKRNQS